MDIIQLLNKSEFPRSSRYELSWIIENQMGPNALWLAEWLAEVLPLRSGMRVLDLGCGRAMTSIFLAKEFGVRVWATDLWITPVHNWKRALEAEVEDFVFPLRSEAHSLPFPEGFFDAVVSIDAYQYFGTDVLYLGYLSRFIRPGGILGVVMPALMQPIDDEIPEHLVRPQANGKVFWEDGCWSFKTADWWRDLWRRNSSVTDVEIDILPEGWRHWRDFEKALAIAGKSVFPSDAEALDSDQGRYIGFIRAVAKRTEANTMNLYDPAIGARVGVDG
ncbi:MAG: methyltransferase domain-containing protein [Pseudomonadota bacterium]